VPSLSALLRVAVSSQYASETGVFLFYIKRVCHNIYTQRREIDCRVIKEKEKKERGRKKEKQIFFIFLIIVVIGIELI
jgi:hypothetical protein